jgi:hypothetical protein
MKNREVEVDKEKYIKLFKERAEGKDGKVKAKTE